MSSVQAVIWDFGGVISSSPFEAFSRYEAERGLPRDFLRTVNATNPHDNAWARLERSEFDLAAFDEAFAVESRALGHEVRGRDVLPLLAGQIRPEMVEALRRIGRRMKTGCITNNFTAMGASPMGSLYKAEVMGLFHHVIESAKAGPRKPDPRIYRMMTEALGVDPRLFIDPPEVPSYPLVDYLVDRAVAAGLEEGKRRAARPRAGNGAR